MDKDQLVSLVLNLYKAKLESKDYLDFFLNPDIDKRLKKAQASIDKAVYRSRRGVVKPKITQVKNAVNSISALDPGDEYVVDIMIYAFIQYCSAGMWGRMNDATIKSIMKHLTDTIVFADKCGLSDKALPLLQNAIDQLKTDYMYRRDFKRNMEETLSQAIANRTQIFR